MIIYKDPIITDNLKSLIKNELTQNLINNITSNWQVKPDVLVLYDHKYILQDIRQVECSRKKLATCNECVIDIGNNTFKYSGVNESKLFSDVAINVFFSYSGEYISKFAGWLDKKNIQTDPSNSIVTLTCRDNAKHFQERRISTPIYDESYYGVNDWHCLDLDGIKKGWQWTRGEVFRDICYLVGMTDEEFSIQLGADDIVRDSFFDTLVLDVWAKLAQGILWETYFDGCGVLNFKPQKTILDPVDFYFKEERDIKRIGIDKTDDFVINDVILIGESLEETAVTYPFAQVATLEQKRLDQGKSLSNLIIEYPDLVSPDNIDTLENALTSTTLIKDNGVYTIADNPENNPWFDVRVHCPSYGQPFQRELVLEKSSMTTEVKNIFTKLNLAGDGITEKTFSFADDQDFNDTPIYLSENVYIEEDYPSKKLTIKIFRGQVQANYSLDLTEVDNLEADEAPGVVYYAVFDAVKQNMALYSLNTIVGGKSVLLVDLTKEVINQEIRILRDINGVIYFEGEWEDKTIYTVIDNPDKELINAEEIGLNQYESVYIDMYLVDKNDDEEIYRRQITRYYVNGDPISEDQYYIINNWLEEVENPDNYQIFFYEEESEEESEKGKSYFKYEVSSGTKVEISKSEFLIAAKDQKNVVISCFASSLYGGCSFKSISESAIEVEAINESPSLVQEFTFIAIVNQIANIISAGWKAFLVKGYYLAMGYIMLYSFIGATIPKFGHVQFRVKVWAKRKEEISEFTNLAVNSDGWLSNPIIDDLGENKVLVWEKYFGAPIPIRQIGYKNPEISDDQTILLQFRIYAFNRDLETGEINKDEILVDMTGYDVPFNNVGYWWDFFQRRDDFELRNYQYIQFQLFKLEKREENETVDLLQQMIETIEGGEDKTELYQKVFNTDAGFENISFHVPYWLDEHGEELVEAEVIYAGQNSAHLNIDNQFIRDPIEIDIRVWGKAYGKYAPTIISHRESSEKSINQFEYRNVEIRNPLISDQNIASEITRKIINSAKGELEIIDWESTGKLQLFEGAIATIKEESTGFASGLRFVWAAHFDEPISAPWRGRIALESSNRVLLVDRDSDESQIIEIDQNSQILWKCQGFVSPIDVKRLSYEGNTLIADYGANQIVEVTYADIDIVWSYDTGEFKPLSVDRQDQLTAMGLYSVGQSVVRVINTQTKERIFETTGVREPFRVQLLTDEQILIADAKLGWVRILSIIDGSVINEWACVTPVDAQITEEGNLLICDAGEPDGAPRIVPKIWEQNLGGVVLWEIDYSNNPDPIFTDEYICETFRPVSVDKDISGNVLIIDQNNNKVYKVKPNSNIYIFEVSDSWIAPDPSIEGQGGEYLTKFRGIPIEQAAFMQLTNFGRSFITDQTSKELAERNYIAEAIVIEVLAGDRYKVETLATGAEMEVSNATVELYRKNDTVLVSFAYGERNGQRSIIGRKLLNAQEIEKGKPKTVNKVDANYWTSTNNSSVDLSDIKNKLRSLEVRIAELESG